MNKFVTGREPSNPLEPLYKLPFFEPGVATPPKFLRDSIDVSVSQSGVIVYLGHRRDQTKAGCDKAQEERLDLR